MNIIYSPIFPRICRKLRVKQWTSRIITLFQCMSSYLSGGSLHILVMLSDLEGVVCVCVWRVACVLCPQYTLPFAFIAGECNCGF